jgi:transmembrane sensor
MKNEELIKKWLNGELSPAEWDVLKTLPEYRDYNRIVESAARFEKPDFDADRNFDLIQGRLKKSDKGKVRSLVIPSVLKIAAVIMLLLASGWFIYYHSPTSISTGIGEISYYQLPDNSGIRLNAESSVKYFPRKWDGDRSLSLEGEAFFEVENGKKFEVKTSQGIIQVLGTKFNVKNRSGFFEVTCYEGAVRVIHEDQETILLPNEYFKVVGESIQAGSDVAEEFPGWIEKESRFNAVPLKFVLEDIERQFGIQIEAGSVNREQLFTGSFSHSNREAALKSVTIPLGLKFRNEAGNKVRLYEE